MSAPLEMKGEDVVAYLLGQSSVRDGGLASLIIHSVDQEPVVDLTFEMVQERRCGSSICTCAACVSSL